MPSRTGQCAPRSCRSWVTTSDNEPLISPEVFTDLFQRDRWERSLANGIEKPRSPSFVFAIW
jgi:hypothetical protein